MTGFATTRWSLIVSAASGSSQARGALEDLCRAYRAPVLAYVQRRVGGLDQANDLTQAFFTFFLERRLQSVADPTRGRFRGFLLACVRNFLNEQHASANSLRRGGGGIEVDPEVLHTLASGDSPELAFDREFALTLLARALERLRQDARQHGRQGLFDALRPFLTENPDANEYQQLAEQLGMRRNTVAVAIHRLRHRLRDMVRAEIADAVASPDMVEEELEALRGVIGNV